MNSTKSKISSRLIYSIGAHTVMLIVAFFSLLPLYIMIMGSFKDTPELLLNSIGLPKSFNLDNYYQLWNYNSGTIIKSYVNAIFIAVVWNNYRIYRRISK